MGLVVEWVWEGDQGSWEQAQFLELVEPEGGTLLSQDEKFMARNQAAAERKLARIPNSMPPAVPQDYQRGAQYKGERKGEQKGKGYPAVENPFQQGGGKGGGKSGRKSG